MKKASKVKWREIVVEHFRLLTWGGGGGIETTFTNNLGHFLSLIWQG